ncbi:hypothetical protein FNH05_23330 [Amycolatopsis rhizosphaerae]|uniref:TfuA-like core domain-containing protein n=1 Tax=Amycolatopsis rhizosphaerae TaxID=2053003 RepID=A0A558BWI3_9PSEU|nr:hypothetical protein FNH05_23330 [Amycolatopsis rhizosphaerae]
MIDGYFHHVPSVQHKEILYAQHQGLMVVGCSSMGALRAAELTDFGTKCGLWCLNCPAVSADGLGSRPGSVPESCRPRRRCPASRSPRRSPCWTRWWR